MDIACELVNRAPSSMLDGNTLHEVWNCKKAYLKNLRVFCCGTYVHVPKENGSKMDKRT